MTLQPVHRPRFTCPHCGRSTPNPDDVRERYCPGCHWWTGVPELYGPWRREREAERQAGRGAAS